MIDDRLGMSYATGLVLLLLGAGLGAVGFWAVQTLVTEFGLV